MAWGSLTPPEIDPLTGLPFTPDDAAQGKFQRIATAVGQGLKHWVDEPGKRLWGTMAPQTGPITEEDVFRQDLSSKAAADWGAGTAFGMLGVGTPAAMMGSKGTVGAAGGKLQSALPMDEASRMARAREQGFGDKALRNEWAAKMLDDPEYGKLPHIQERYKPIEHEWYHGTQSPEFPEFKTGGVKRQTADWNTMLGPHFADGSGAANMFAEGHYTRKTEGGRVMPVQLNIQNPKRYKTETDLSDDAVRWAVSNGNLTADDFKRGGTDTRGIGAELAKSGALPDWAYGFGGEILKGAGNKRRPIADGFKRYLAEQGHDGITYGNNVEGVASRAAIPFEPKQIRGRFAAFDPANKDSGFILGSGSRDPAQTAAGTVAQATRDAPMSMSGIHEAPPPMGHNMPPEAIPIERAVVPRNPPAKRSTELVDVRGVPVDEAIRIASKEPHLIRSGEQSEGFFIGAPRNIQSRTDLLKRRRDFDRYIDADPYGGDWYDRYRSGVVEVTGNDPVLNKWMSSQEGQWSAGVSPESELGFALKENNAAIAGKPVKSARPAQHEAHMAAIEAKDPSEYQLGKKTGEYARRIEPDPDRVATATGVNDFRHARNFGYTEVDGGAQRGQLTAAQHRFLDYETALAVKRANKRNLGGRSDWTGEQLQAAPWVRQKALDIQKRAGKTKDGAPKLSYDDAFKRANTTIADFFDKHTAFATHEAMPGAQTGHLPGSVAAAEGDRVAFSTDPRSRWDNAPGDRDAIYAGTGIEDTGVYMRTRPSNEMQGLYTTPEGVVETNPGMTARPLVAFDAGKTKTVPQADQNLLNAAEATRGYVDAQNAAAWHKPWMGGQAGQSNSLFFPRSDKAPTSVLLDLQRRAAEHGLPDVVDTGQGLTATRFYPPPEKLTNKAIDSIAAGAASPPARVKVDSGYIDYVPHWQEGLGSGAATKELLSHLNVTPEIRAAFNSNPYLAKNAMSRVARDKDYADRWGAPREDIQNARKIIGEGRGWVDRLEQALAAGAILPATALAILASAREGQAGQQ